LSQRFCPFRQSRLREFVDRCFKSGSLWPDPLIQLNPTFKPGKTVAELLAELESANRQLTEYAARVEDLTIAAERQRMARELHDTLSQGLAGLILQLEAADAHLAADRPERARGILEQSMEKARGTLKEARQVIDDLRQPAGHDLAGRRRHRQHPSPTAQPRAG